MLAEIYEPPLVLYNLWFDLAHRLYEYRKRTDSQPARSSHNGQLSQYQSGFPPPLRMDPLKLRYAPIVDDYLLAADFRCSARL